MKLKAITVAALCACGTTAMAQSSVTVSGFVSLGVGKPIGTKDKQVLEDTTGNSRLAFTGREDLGGGYAAVFHLEHRLRPDMGAEGTVGKFWSGLSMAGLQTPYGRVTLGRQYNPTYEWVQGLPDPFGSVTIANFRDIGMRPGAAIHGLSNTPNGVATVSKVRMSDSIRYDYASNGLQLGVSFGERTQEGGTTTGPNIPYALAARYTAGDLIVAAGYENPQYDNDHQWNAAVRYRMGATTLSAGGATGKTANRLNLKGYMVGVNYNVGSGDYKFAYGQSKVGAVERKKIAVGYHYALSKRTKIYADLAHESEIAANKVGYDLGLVVRF